MTIAGRMNTGLDEGHRRLDPLPDRMQGRKIVVSPKIDDEKGKRHFIEMMFLHIFFHEVVCSIVIFQHTEVTLKAVQGF